MATVNGFIMRPSLNDHTPAQGRSGQQSCTFKTLWHSAISACPYKRPYRRNTGGQIDTGNISTPA
jgi:hypothetical protein